MQFTFTNKLIQENYDVKEFLKEINNGNLYLAKNKKTDQDVFLNVFASNFYSHAESAQDGQERFEQLMNTANKLESPHLSKVLDYDYVTNRDTDSYLTIAHHDYPSLLSSVKNNDLEIEDRISIVSSLTSVLEQLHSSNCVLGNLHPDNVHVYQDNKLDFQGLISYLGTDNPKYSLNEHAQNAYYQFIHPELFKSANTLQPQHDVYSLGVLLYYMLTDTYPYAGDDIHEYMTNVENTFPTPLTDYVAIPQHISSFCTNLLTHSLTNKEPSPLKDISKSLDSFVNELCSITAYDFDMSGDFLSDSPKKSSSDESTTSEPDSSDSAIEFDDLETSSSSSLEALPYEGYFEDAQTNPTVTLQSNEIDYIGRCIGEIYLPEDSHQGCAYTVSGSNHLVMAANNSITIYDLNDGAREVKKIDAIFGNNRLRHVALVESKVNDYTPIYCFVAMDREDGETTTVHTYNLSKGVREVHNKYCSNGILLSQTDTINPFFVRDYFLYLASDDHLMMYDLRKSSKDSKDHKFPFARSPLLLSPRKKYTIFSTSRKNKQPGLSIASILPERVSQESNSKLDIKRLGTIAETYDHMTYAPKNNLLYLQHGSEVSSFILSPSDSTTNSTSSSKQTSCIKRSTSNLSPETKRIKTTYIGNNLFGIEEDQIALYSVEKNTLACNRSGRIHYNMNDLFVDIHSYRNSKFTIIEEEQRLCSYILFDS